MGLVGLAEELGRIVVTESTAGVSSLPVLAHKSGMTPVVRVGGKPISEEGMSLYYIGLLSRCWFYFLSTWGISAHNLISL